MNRKQWYALAVLFLLFGIYAFQSGNSAFQEDCTKAIEQNEVRMSNIDYCNRLSNNHLLTFFSFFLTLVFLVMSFLESKEKKK